MARHKKIIGGTVALLAAGYAIGLLTAPRSGKRTRKHFKTQADNSVSEVEKQLKNLYKQSQESIAQFSKDNPKLTAKLKEVKAQATSSQAKLKNLLSALHDNDALDDDLSKAISEAKDSFKHLNKYITKKA